MNNKDKKIALSFYKSVCAFYCTFNLKVNDKIIVYSIELGIIVATLDINDDIQLYNFMNHTGLCLLPSLFYYTPDKEIKYCWNSKYKNWFNQSLIDKPIDESTDAPTDEQTKFVFGILNECVWKSKFYENMSKTKVIECETYNHLNVHSFNPYMDTVSTLFQNATCDSKEELTESIENLIKWEIFADDDKIRLKVFKQINTKWELISERCENYPYRPKSYIHYIIHHKFIASSLFNNNDIVILTTFAGDSSALSNWSYADNPSIAILIVLFSLLIVVYLMNLLIGLLNNAIEEDNNRVSYLIQKAEILAEIELFYLLPHQRRWQTWFPEVIHYYANVDKTRIEIERLIKEGEWDNKEFTEMREKLLEQLQIKYNPIGNEVILEKVKSNDVKLDKLEKLEEKLNKFEKLEEKLEKLDKRLAEKINPRCFVNELDNIQRGF
ncbi:hypothetical protein GLOIN_2v1581148 [Rhizophagus irregularis DAOM 181602=DAOM 197198]|nr:hypothetical protein GLOIN_2v1581148 [Rhizophagus irregularis DAOM 181602=DAOM 197198]